MQTLKLFFILIFVLLLQGRMGFWTNPDFLLIFIVFLAVKEDKTKTISFAFWGGFLRDILFSLGFVFTFVSTLIGIIIIYIRTFFVLEEKQLIVILTAIFTPCSFIFSFFITHYFYSSGTAYFPFWEMIVSTMLNVLFTPLCYFLFDRFITNDE
ncbi:hypothetical protein A2230_00495 [candidate division WOR-1 bacterium RIFOXYA2_FULL_36_21]|uniref:Rod shape-determining protein MreD n=1 Tax=candidate division WOR-1 bacterium RIFOXYB2_FULL_36_35 TaxID=1802578 RepID=A0A1F4S5J8_UNCSA|nr:MAG: hypothetical protein A2230_00495 [candidate division WOR-1 bacterium RIFOXYA2_FULL_36_21]OGC15647.1 MAG: hypothetical protein A2290_06195 [candidate division WOR-1 bacterium RIFOXYB2_FULL_36_35]OGC16395.1 MAG: hypothetical protein A2282_00540 [candidate division WOR-1 bacterium RIFOXYA12_FULL_36_13]